MNSCTPVIDWRLIGALFAGLFFFGLSFNGLVVHLGHRKDGYTSLLVVGGVLVTVGALAVVEPLCALLTLGFFASSGLPMILGDIYRAMRQRDAERQAVRESHE